MDIEKYFKIMMIVYCIDTAKKITTTPLLEYLKVRKQEKQRLRDEKREERRRRDMEKRRTRDDPVISKVEKLLRYIGIQQIQYGI